jgi:hypothetical protein
MLTIALDEVVSMYSVDTWRGVTRRAPILTGRTYMHTRIGPGW